MKKLLFLLTIAACTFACNDSAKPSTTSTDTAAAPAPAAATPAATDTTSATAATTLKEGLMTMKDGKMMIVKSGAWAALDAPVTCTNGRKVAVDGQVSKGDKKRKLEEGMMIDKDGQMMDKNGKLMDTSGWD